MSRLYSVLNTITTRHTSTKDWIVEQGTSNGWTYRKWNSGIGECWRNQTHTGSFSNAWGALYYDPQWQPANFPFVFSAIPVFIAQVAAVSGDNIMPAGITYTGVTTTKAPGTLSAVHPQNGTNKTYTVAMYAVGKWK